MKKNILQLTIFGPTLLFIAIMFFLITQKAPTVGIDNYYAMHTIDQDINLPFLLSRAIYRCLTWNARIGEFLYYFIAPLAHIIHDILNTMFFIVFILLILFYAFDYDDKKHISKKNFSYYALIIFAIILVFEPLLWSDFFWIAGSCNHFWGICILLTFFIPFRKFYFKTYKMSKTKLSLYCLLGIIAGTTSENIVPVLLIIISTIIIYKYIKEKKIYSWTIISFISLLIGYIWLMFNPSTWYRYNNMGNQDWAEGTKINMFYQFFTEYKYYFIILFVLLLLYVLKLLYKKFVKHNNIIIEKSFIYNSIFFATSFISLFIMLFSSYFYTRALLIISFCFLTLFVYIIHDLTHNIHFSFKIIVSVLMIITILYYSLYIRKLYINVNNINKDIDEYVNNQLENKSTETVYIPIYIGETIKRILTNSTYELYYSNILKEKYKVPDNTNVIYVNFYDYVEIYNYINN